MIKYRTIKELRAKAEITLVDLSSATHVPPSQICLIERRRVVPSLLYLKRLADYFCVKLADLEETKWVISVA